MSPTLSAFFHPARSNLLARGARLCNHQSEWPIRIHAWVSDRIGARSWFISWVDRSIYSFDVMYEGCATVLHPGRTANVRVAENVRAIRFWTGIDRENTTIGGHRSYPSLTRRIYIFTERRMINASLRNCLLLRDGVKFSKNRLFLFLFSFFVLGPRTHCNNHPLTITHTATPQKPKDRNTESTQTWLLKMAYKEYWNISKT